jgi:hypothetical protein
MKRAQSPNPYDKRKMSMKQPGSDKLIRSKSPKIEEENGLFPELEDYMKRTDRKVSNMIRKRNLEIDVN